jgi:hypothetical protein
MVSAHMVKRKDNVQILNVNFTNNNMKNLKQITSDKYKEFQKIFDEACEKREIYKKKHNWKELSLDEKIKLTNYYKEFDKFFKPAFKAEKVYLKAKLSYLNSSEYTNGEYKTDSKKYNIIVSKINYSLKELKKVYSKLKADKRARWSIRIGNNRDEADFGETKDIINSFIELKKSYCKKPGNYNYKDVQTLYSRYTLGRGFEGQKIWIKKSICK